jgi:hypothetical protein
MGLMDDPRRIGGDNSGVWAMHTIAERLLTIILAAVLLGGVSIFAVTAFTWLWIKRRIEELRAWLRAWPSMAAR